MSASMTASMISTPSPTVVAPLPAKSKTPEPLFLVQHGESIDSSLSTIADTSLTTPSTDPVTNGLATAAVATTNGTIPTEIEQVATTAIDEIVAAASDAVWQKAASVDRDSLEGDAEVAEPQIIVPEVSVVEPVAQQQPQLLKPTVKAVADLNVANSLNDSVDNGDLMTGE